MHYLLCSPPSPVGVGKEDLKQQDHKKLGAKVDTDILQYIQRVTRMVWAGQDEVWETTENWVCSALRKVKARSF